MRLSDRLLQAAAIVGRRTPLILQTETAECGLACLAMIAGRYGYRVDLPALRQSYNFARPHPDRLRHGARHARATR
jgi:ABC-type bacteriocin/lantibiotic exporter with double-glycine peptidase domain